MKRITLVVITLLSLKAEAGLTNFETTSRDWSDDLFRDDLDWKLYRGQLTNNDGRGNFIYLTTSAGNYAKSASLESRILRTPSRGSCVSFWYRISGKDPGVLKLKRMEIKRTEIRTRQLWLREGDQGRTWNFARVSIPFNPNTKYYQIVMESTLGTSGEVAIDDIDLDASHPCSNSLRHGGFAVDFESKVTAMKNKRYGDHFDWSITKGGSWPSNSGTGPDHDVTSGFGHYLHLSTNGKISGHRASYGSNPVPASTKGACLSFYYNMNGDEVGKLTVSILRKSGWISTAKSVWSKTGSINGGWHFAKISLANSLTMQRYDVMFTGTVGKGASGGIALDDITLINTGIC